MSDEVLETTEQPEKKRMGRPPRDTGSAEATETVTMSKEDLAALMARISRLENPGIPDVVEREERHFAYLRTWDGGIVTKIGYAQKNYNAKEASQDQIIPISIERLDGSKENLTLPLYQFMEEALRINCEIVKEERKKVKEKKGMIALSKSGVVAHEGEVISKEANFDEYTGKNVPQIIERIVHTVTLRVLEGEFKDKEFTFTDDETRVINT